MKKLFLSLLLIPLLCSCGTRVSSENSASILTPSLSGESANTNQEQEMPNEAKEFVNIVNTLRFDENFDYNLNEAYYYYDLIDDDTWNRFSEVQEAYYKLVMLEEIYYEYLRANNMAEDFIAKVDAIPFFLTLDDERYIIAAESAYDELDNKNIIGVEEAYAKLLVFRAQFDQMFLDSIEKSLEEEIASFLEIINKLPSIDNLTLSDKNLLVAAEDAYEYLSLKAKEDERVINAKTLIDQLNEKYKELMEHPEYADQVVISAFLTAIDAIDVVTLKEGTNLFRAKDLYQSLSSSSKNLENVQKAYVQMMAYFDEYCELYIAVNGAKEETKSDDNTQVLVDEFVNLVESINDLDSITLDDALSITNAEKYYDTLTIKALNRSEVKENYEKLELARAKLNTYLSDSIPLNVNLLFSTDQIQNIVLQSQTANFYADIKNFYGVSSGALLKEKASMYLYVSKQEDLSSSIVSINVSNALYEASTVILGQTIVTKLEEQSLFDQNLVGNRFYFGLQIKDRTGLYKESSLIKSKLSQNVYNFTNMYKDVTDESIVPIYSTEDFLAIKENLKANYVLKSDIDLAGIEWENLGEFFGTLDGNGHTIKNITRNTEGLDGEFGLFLEVKANAVVKDLVLEGDVEKAGAWAGAIAVRNYGTISDCFINLHIASTGNIGGIVCENHTTGTIENCIVLSSINGSQEDGGICVGQYGKVLNTYFLGENVTNGKAVGNSNSLSECNKTDQELKNSNLYSAFDKRIWCVWEGFYPTLVRYK